MKHHASQANIKSSAKSDLIQNSRVSMILNKSKFWEDRITNRGLGSDIKTVMLQKSSKANMDSLTKLKDSLANYTQQEMKLLERKNAELIDEYNRLIHNFKL